MEVSMGDETNETTETVDQRTQYLHRMFALHPKTRLEHVVCTGIGDDPAEAKKHAHQLWAEHFADRDKLPIPVLEMTRPPHRVKRADPHG